jgi:TP901 family phage tail tape measure protein
MDTTLTLLINGNSSGAVKSIGEVKEALGNLGGGVRISVGKVKQSMSEVAKAVTAGGKEVVSAEQKYQREIAAQQINGNNQAVQRQIDLNAKSKSARSKALRDKVADIEAEVALGKKERDAAVKTYKQMIADGIDYNRDKGAVVRAMLRHEKVLSDGLEKELSDQDATRLESWRRGQDNLKKEKELGKTRSAEVKKQFHDSLKQKMDWVEAERKLNKISAADAMNHYAKMLGDMRLFERERKQIATAIARHAKEAPQYGPFQSAPAMAPMGPTRQQILANQSQRLQAFRSAGETGGQWGRSATWGMTVPIVTTLTMAAKEFAGFEQKIGAIAAALELGGGGTGNAKGLRKSLSKEILTLSTKDIGLPIEDVADLALQGAQAGVAQKNLAEYVKTLYRLKLLIPEIQTEELAEKFNKLMVSSGKDLDGAGAILQKEFSQLATIGALSAAGSKQVLNASSRISGPMKNIGGSTTLTYALAGAGTGAGLEPEAFTTQIGAFLGRLLRAKESFNSKTGGDSMLKMLAGLVYGERNNEGGSIQQQKKLAEALVNDTDNIVLRILENLRNAQQGQSNIMEIYREIGLKNERGSRSFFTIGGVNNQKSVGQFYKAAINTDQDNVTKTLLEREQETLRQYQMVVNKFREAAIELGAGLLPNAGHIIKMIKDLADGLVRLAKAYNELSPENQKRIIDGLLFFASLGPAVTMLAGMVTGLANLLIVVNKFAQLKLATDKIAALTAMLTGVEGAAAGASAGIAGVGVAAAGANAKVGFLRAGLAKLGAAPIGVQIFIALAIAEGSVALYNWLNEKTGKKLPEMKGPSSTISATIGESYNLYKDTNAAEASQRGYLYNPARRHVERRQYAQGLLSDITNGKPGDPEYIRRRKEAEAYAISEGYPGAVMAQYGVAPFLRNRIKDEGDALKTLARKTGAKAAAEKRGEGTSGTNLFNFDLSSYANRDENGYIKGKRHLSLGKTGGNAGSAIKDEAQDALNRAKAAYAAAQAAVESGYAGMDYDFENSEKIPTSGTKKTMQGLISALASARTVLARATAEKQVASGFDKNGVQLKPKAGASYILSEVAAANKENAKGLAAFNKKMEDFRGKEIDIKIRTIATAEASLAEDSKTLKGKIDTAVTLEEKQAAIKAYADNERKIAEKQLWQEQSAALKVGDKVALGIAGKKYSNTLAGIGSDEQASLDDVWNKSVQDMISVLEARRKQFAEDEDEYMGLTDEIRLYTDALKRRTSTEIFLEATERENAEITRRQNSFKMKQQAFETQAGMFDPSQTNWLTSRNAGRRAGALAIEPNEMLIDAILGAGSGTERAGLIGRSKRSSELGRYLTQSGIEQKNDEVTQSLSRIADKIESFAFGGKKSGSFVDTLVTSVQATMNNQVKDSDREKTAKEIAGLLGEGFQASVGLFGAGASLDLPTYMTGMTKLKGLNGLSPKGVNDIDKSMGDVLKEMVGNRLGELDKFRISARGGKVDDIEKYLKSLPGWTELPRQLKDGFKRTFDETRMELAKLNPRKIAARRGEQEIRDTLNNTGKSFLAAIFNQEGGQEAIAGGYGSGTYKKTDAIKSQWKDFWKEAMKSIKTSLANGIWDGLIQAPLDTLVDKFSGNLMKFLHRFEGSIAQFSVYASVLAGALGAGGGKNQRNTLIGGALGLLAGSLIPGLSNVQGASIGASIGQGYTAGGPLGGLMSGGAAYGAFKIGNPTAPSIPSMANTTRAKVAPTINLTQNIERIGKDDVGWYNEGLTGDLERVLITKR